jgi:hypothetical protein
MTPNVAGGRPRPCLSSPAVREARRAYQRTGGIPVFEALGALPAKRGPTV